MTDVTRRVFGLFGDLRDNNGNIYIHPEARAAAVNYIQVRNAEAGVAVGIHALGSDTNIALNLRPKGNLGVLIDDANNHALTVIGSAASGVRLVSSGDIIFQSPVSVEVIRLQKTNGNILIGALTAVGTNATKVIGMPVGTPPITSPASAAQLWVADVGGIADKAGFHMRDETGNSGPIAFANVVEYTKAASDTITANQLYGGQITNYGQSGDATLTLPAAVLGMNFSVILGTTVANFYNIDPAAGDSIYLDGATTGDGKYVGVASAALGNAIRFTTFTTAGGVAWFATTISGTWVAEA